MKTQILSSAKAKSETHNLVSELVEILRDELAAHHKILHLELAKREAIIARDGDKLKASATEQAAELHLIDLLENRREKLIAQLCAGKDNPTLSQIIESEIIPAPEKKELGRYQLALRSALNELKKLSELNTRMLADSRELFKTMILSLARKNPEKRHEPSRPVLVDANC